MHLTLSLVTTFLAGARLASSQTVTVTPAITYQEIDGFGLSEAFYRAQNVLNLPAANRQQALDALFSTTTGAGFTIIRNRIGSGGSGDSIEPNAPATNASTPTYSWDGYDEGQVWFSQQAMSYGVKTIYANAWGAPGFMKTTGTDINGGYLCGVTGESCASGDWRHAYAGFLLQYVQFYAQAGIPVTHVGFLNEPEISTSYSSMQSDGTQAASFIPILYEVFHSAGWGNISFTCCDAEGWGDQATFTSQIIAAGAESYLNVITSHAYTGDPTYPISTSLKTWETEAADLNDAFCPQWYSSGSACEGLTWANKIATGILSANLSAYLYWEGIDVNATTTSGILITSDGTTVETSGRLWAFAMWSRWVRPGAYRVETTGTISGIQYGAFKNVDGSIAVVFTNTGATAASVIIAFNGFSAASASAWVTDNASTVGATTATVSGGTVSVSVPAYSVVTVKIIGGGVVSSSSTSKSTSSTSKSTSSASKTSTITTKTTSKSSTKTTTVKKTSSTSTTITKITTTSVVPTSTQTLYGQCGGTSWSGPTACATPYLCTTYNPYYAQCII